MPAWNIILAAVLGIVDLALAVELLGQVFLGAHNKKNQRK